ncbi:MAG: hypothetical protein PUC15_03730 [Lentisphaeria bacterium]|nr:hypothetical protein [Lentisphaeria bacterium]
MSALLAAWTAFSFGPSADAEETKPGHPKFQKVLVLFSADTAKADRDEFLAGLETVRLGHRLDYFESLRKQREADSESNSRRAAALDPDFLDVVDVQMVRADRQNPSYDPSRVEPRLWDMESIPRYAQLNDPADALIVVASDVVSAELTRMIRTGFLESRGNDTVVLFAGVSSFDESIRESNGTEQAKAPHSFAIQYPGDPWPNTDLALMSFPKTRKVILLAPRRWWNAEKMEKYREKLGPARSVKTIFLPEVPAHDVTEANIAALKEQFTASVKAEIERDKTVIVSLSSIETGEDPISWLPENFNFCPIFADTKPARPSSVGGFCRSMETLGGQAADLLEQLSEDSLYKNKIPAIILENDELWLNSHAVRQYGLKTASFPETALLMSTSSTRVPVRLGYTGTRKRIAALLLANAFLFVCVVAYVFFSVRRARLKRQIAESVYSALPVRVFVMDRDGRLLEYHKSYGEVERRGEFPWKNINDVPWLRGLGIGEAVQEVFDSGKKSVREIVVEGERRVVVLSRTETDVLGRPAVIAVSSDSPARDA